MNDLKEFAMDTATEIIQSKISYYKAQLDICNKRVHDAKERLSNCMRDKISTELMIKILSDRYDYTTNIREIEKLKYENKKLKDENLRLIELVN